MYFTIPFKFKPYVRMTRRGQWVDKQALEYKDSQTALAWTFRSRMTEMGWEMFPPRTPLRVNLNILMPDRLHCQDGDNQIKAIVDAAQGVVFPDDRWIDEIHMRRSLGDGYLIQVEIEVLNA